MERSYDRSSVFRNASVPTHHGALPTAAIETSWLKPHDIILETGMAEGTHGNGRDSYAAFRRITTRWMDNDSYQHVNNVTYYSFFDTAVNQLLIESGALDIATSPTIGLVVQTECRYFSPITFPDVVVAGIRVSKLGTSSVHYNIGLFRETEETPSAEGHFVHVYVNRETRRPERIPDNVRIVLETLI